MYNRLLNPLTSNSFFLFGARGTGKSTLLRNLLSDVLVVDLLNTDIYTRLLNRPSELNEMLESTTHQWCLIDEVQKVPQLLDVVHSQIEKKKIKFALTGSSARKLKRNDANMLAGRAFLYKLFPLSHWELGNDFDLNEAINYGTLPRVLQLTSPREKISFLKSYVNTYLKEEILAEQLIRNLPPFSRFLEVAASCDTEITNFSNIAADIHSDSNNVRNYYSILEETLLGFFLEPYHTSIRKRQKRSPKFYLFDTGVRRALAGTLDTPITPKSFEYGSLFENFVVNEIHRLLTYAERSFKLSFIRVDNNMEVDLVLERKELPTYLIEIKSTDYIREEHLKSLTLYSKDIPNSIPLCLSLDKVKRKISNVMCMHWQEGIKELGIAMP